MTIQSNLINIRQAITTCEKKYGREQGSVQLLAASKHQPVEKILEAFQAGQTIFGESYVQEALLKMNALMDKPIAWHFIGPIQSNKTRKIAEHFSWVHSVGSMKIAKRLNEQRPTALPPLNICIEVNISHEQTKSGLAIDAVLPLAQYCLTLPQIRLRGLMSIPAPHTDLQEQRNTFHPLFSLWQSLRQQGIMLDTLSLGMSEDFEAAIAEGSTIVRIGRALFR